MNFRRSTIYRGSITHKLFSNSRYLHIDVWKECKEVARSKSNLVVGKKFAFKVELKNKGMGRLVDTAPDIQLIE